MKSFFSLITLSLCFVSHAQKSINSVEVATIASTFLNESRDIWIGLPTNYDTTKSYPTLYVLDAEWWFDITYALTKELHDNQASTPEMIVIGIPQIDRKHRKLNMTFSDSKNNAMALPDTRLSWDKSQTGGGPDFLNYIEKEVVTYIDSTYSTNNFNSMVGHSLGGYFCAYALTIQTSFSSLFIFDASIWYNSGDALKKIKNKLSQDINTNVFISSGLMIDGPQDMIANHLEKIDSLKLLLQTYHNINLHTKTYPNKQHLSMYMYSVIDGLNTIFDHYDYGFIKMEDKITLHTYLEHYKQLSDRLGFEIAPPMDGIRRIAYVNSVQKNWQNALDAYLICYPKYKNDININQEIANCYKNLGNKKNSKYYSVIAKRLESE